MDEPAPGATRPAQDGTASPPPETGPGAGKARTLRISGSGGGFESEFNAHLQDRLRLGTGFMAAASLVLFLVGRVGQAAATGDFDLELRHPSVVTHLLASGVAVAAWLALRRGPLGGRVLGWIDGLVAETSILAAVLIFSFSHRTGIAQVVPLTGLFLVARAVVVPSRPLRTLLLSAPAMAAFLAVRLRHGEAFGYLGQPLLQEAFPAVVLWDQATLGFSVAVAALTSKVNFALRVRAWEAKQVDRYTLEERIGVGAMGEVYRARHGLLRRPTAIKLLRPEIAGERNLARFEMEVRQTARLTHPNTISIFDYGTTDAGEFYYAMEFVDGLDLDGVVEAAGPLPPERVIHVLAQVCGALAEAHGIGLIHRDLKPANIMLCTRGGEADVVKVMDFGLVMDLREGAAAPEAGLAGTPHTMSPEVIRGHPPTPAVDLYAVGAVGCFLLTGRPIFDAVSATEFLLCHMQKEPVAPSSRVAGVPADLEALLLGCLRKDPAARPPSVKALRESLLACTHAGRWTAGRAGPWWEEHGRGAGGAGGGG